MPVMSTARPPAARPAPLFPSLVVNVNTGAIVLASSRTVGGSITGTLVGYERLPGMQPLPPRQEVGHHQTNWDSTAFKTYEGAVQLENEE